MTALTSLFFDATIGTEEAPQHILESERFSSSYHAILKRRFGRVTADDFLRYARRFTILCNQVYQGSKLELRRNKSIPLGFEVFLASQGGYEGEPGEVIDANRLTNDSFREMFEDSFSIVVNILPKLAREDILHSFAQVQWTRSRPKTIFFYAQQGGRYDLEGIQRPLENLLLRKLFHVPSAPPSINFTVKLGVSGWANKAEGKLH